MSSRIRQNSPNSFICLTLKQDLKGPNNILSMKGSPCCWWAWGSSQIQPSAIQSLCSWEILWSCWSPGKTNLWILFSYLLANAVTDFWVSILYHKYRVLIWHLATNAFFNPICAFLTQFTSGSTARDYFCVWLFHIMRRYAPAWGTRLDTHICVEKS